MMPNPPPVTPRQFIALILILAVAGWLRFYRIAQPSLWMDELITVELTMGHRTAHDFYPDSIIRTDQPDSLSLASAAPWWHIWNRLQITTHPPIYFISLRWWIDLFGDGPAAIRSLSAILSLAGIIALFDVCRLLHGPRIALLAAAITALAVAQIDIGREARSYPLLILFGLCACDAIVRITTFGATYPRLVLLILSLVALLLTHYFTLGALAALTAFAFLRTKGLDRRRTIISIAIALAIALAAWSYQFYGQMRSLPNFDPSYTRESQPHHPLQVLLRIAQLPLEFCIGDAQSAVAPLAIQLSVAVLVVALMFRLRRRPELLIWILWAGGILLSVAMIDLLRDSALLQIMRYTVLASPAVYALLAAARLPQLKSFSSLIPIAVIAALALADLKWISRGLIPRQDFKQLAEIVDAHALPDELLVFYNDSGWVAPGVWYVGYKYYSPNSHHPWALIRHSATNDFLHQISARKSIWLIGPAPERFGSYLLPGWKPDIVWHTSAGGICLMRQPDSP